MVVSVLLEAGKGLSNRGFVNVRIRQPGWLYEGDKASQLERNSSYDLTRSADNQEILTRRVKIRHGRQAQVVLDGIGEEKPEKRAVLAESDRFAYFQHSQAGSIGLNSS